MPFGVELNRVARSGLVEVTAHGPRGAKTYDVTGAGRAELRRWMMTPPADAKVRNGHVLRKFLISALPREDALSLLDRMSESTDEATAELRRVRAEHPQDAPMRGAEGFGQLAAEVGVRHYEAIGDWARWAAERLRAEG